MSDKSKKNTEKDIEKTTVNETEKDNEREIKEDTLQDTEKITDNDTGKKPVNKRVIVIAVIAILVVAAAIVIPIVLNSNANNNQESTPDSATEPSFVKMVEDSETYQIDLGFVKLRYPDKFKDSVTVSGAEKHEPADKFTVSFASGKTKLFDLIFNQESGNLLGTLKSGDTDTVIYVKTYKIDTNNNELLEQQESLNVIIQGLIADYGFKTGEQPETEENNKVFEIKTDVVSLYYPEKWKGKVDVKAEGKTVSFMNNGEKVFDLRFEECDGYLLGTYNGTPIYMVEYKTKNNDQVAMQQDVNVIINNLSKDKNFKINS